MPHTSRGFRLYYERHGEGEPLLLITGFTISGAVFEPILPLYTQRFECVLYDNRGSGRSRTPLHPTSIPELAADAAGVIDELGLGSAHVCGLSMGGMIAQELAIRFPDRVRGLVLGGTTPGGPRAFRPALNELSALGLSIAGAFREEGRPWLAAAVFSESFRREQPGEVRRLLTFFARHRARPHGVMGHWWASVYHDTTARLHKIQAPTLVMHGGEDAMSPLANARFLAERIPDAELAVVPGAGHAYMLEDPYTSYDMLTAWLDRRGSIAPGRPRTSLLARAEPVTRRLGLPIGAMRTGASLAGLAADRVRGRRAGA